MRSIEEVLERLDGVKRRNGYYTALCPSHDDQNPSLSVKESEDGKVLVYCHAGCSYEQVNAALALGERDSAEPALKARQHRSRTERKVKPNKVWEIRNQFGELKGFHLRFDKPNGDKECLWQRPDGRWGINGTPLSDMPLYGSERAQEWQDDLPLVIVAEGEKATDALLGAGFAALGTVTGASGTPGEKALEVLRGRRVVLWSDNDNEGRKHMQRVAEALQGIAAEVRIFEWEEAPPKGDAADHPGVLSRSRKAIGELLEAMAASPVWESDPVGILLKDVQPEEVRWLWERRIPLGKLTVVDGNPRDGKSVWSTDVAACVSRGWAWPDGGRCPFGGAVICSGEDGVADTILPRLVAAGGDPSKVLALSTVPDAHGNERPLSIPEDLPVIERGIRRVGALVVVIDPLMAFLSGETNAHKDQDVRRAMTPLAKMAERTGAAVIVVRHLNKAAGANPLYRGGGSIGIIGAARSGLVVGRHPENEDIRVLAGVKSNLSLPPESLVYRVETAANGAAHIVYEGTTETKASDLLKVPADEEEKSALSEAKEFLLAELEDGPMAAKQVKKNAHDADISERTLKRAKGALGVASMKEADGSWTWSLPPKGTKGGQASTDGPLGTLGPLEEDGPLEGEYSAYLSQESQGGQGDQTNELEESWPPSTEEEVVF